MYLPGAAGSLPSLSLRTWADGVKTAEDGEETPEEKAERYCVDAALARMLGNPALQLALMEKAAEQGRAGAQFRCGQIYYSGVASGSTPSRIPPQIPMPAPDFPCHHFVTTRYGGVHKNQSPVAGGCRRIRVNNVTISLSAGGRQEKRKALEMLDFQGFFGGDGGISPCGDKLRIQCK